MQNLTPVTWLALDYACDFIYLLDAVVHAHEGLFGLTGIPINYRTERRNAP